jgi:hypothetical protein
MKYHHGDKKKSIFVKQKCMAKFREIEWLLTYEEWIDIWDKSGKWDQRGRGVGKYCMSRIGDTGPYSKDNVYINECVKNSGDKFRGTKQSLDTIAKRSNSLKDVKHSHERRLANRLGQLRYRAKLKTMIT